MRGQESYSLKDLKLCFLKGAILLNGRDPSVTIQSEFCKKTARKLGVEVSSLAKFESMSFKNVSASDLDVLELASFIGEVRRKVIGIQEANEVKQEGALQEFENDSERESRLELDKILAVFQLILLGNIQKPTNTSFLFDIFVGGGGGISLCRVYIPAFVSTINELLNMELIKDEDKANDKELNELAELLGFTNAASLKKAPASDVTKRYKQKASKVHPDKNVDNKESATEDFQKLDGLYKKWVKSSPKTTSSTGFEMKTGASISCIWCDNYLKYYQQSNVDGGKNAAYIAIRRKIFSAVFASTTTTEIVQIIDPLLTALENKVWYQSRMYEFLLATNITMVSASCIAFILPASAGVMELVKGADIPCFTGVALTYSLALFAIPTYMEYQEGNGVRVPDNLIAFMYLTSITVTGIGIPLVALLVKFEDGIKIVSPPASWHLSSKIVGLDIAINAAMLCAYYKLNKSIDSTISLPCDSNELESRLA